MNRRTILRQIGGVSAAASLAGCLSDRPGADGDDSDDQSGATDGDDGNESGDDTDSGDENDSSDDDSSDDDSTTDGGVSSPELVDTGITTHSAECGATDESGISFGDGSVTVEGSIAAPDPCHHATVSAAAYSESDDEFSITIGTAPNDAGEMCADCTAAVAYTATATFDGGTPINVTVSHESAEQGTTTVAEDSRR
jgi:hypothetical protein